LTSASGRWTVPAVVARIRLDQYLAGEMPGWSRSQLQNWIRAGQVRVNGSPAKTGHIVRAGETIVVEIPKLPDDEAPVAEDIPLEVLYQDAFLAVVDKPAGMVCHTGAGIRSGTLVNALLHHLGPLQTGDASRPGIVHRLDKGTSGLLVVARSVAAHSALAQQFKERRVRKQYVALVYGTPTPACGTVDRPLGRDPVDRKKISVRARHARNAVTHYELVESYPGVALTRIRIETGRTHQIRVHMASIGHAVVGDPVYGGVRAPALPAATQAALRTLRRMFLHAERLEFRHPETNQELRFEAPLPAELEQILLELRGRPRPARA
jgi:23S rRNA pseudouridine1911/1915/1917 synthase